MAFQAATATTNLLLDGKSPTLAPLARCGSGCSRSVMRLGESKFSPTSTGPTSSRATTGECTHTDQLDAGDNQEGSARTSWSTAKLRLASVQLWPACFDQLQHSMEYEVMESTEAWTRQRRHKLCYPFIW